MGVFFMGGPNGVLGYPLRHVRTRKVGALWRHRGARFHVVGFFMGCRDLGRELWVPLGLERSATPTTGTANGSGFRFGLLRGMPELS